MKNYKLRALTLLLPLVAAVTGCMRSDEPIGSADGRKAVEFRSGVSTSATRTTAGGNEWVLDDAVGIFMLTHNGTLASGTVAGAANVEYLATPNTDDASKAALSVATPAEKIFYPAEGSVDFVVYYPWRATPETNPHLYSVSVDNQNNPAAIDVMWGKASDYDKTTGPVELAFNHVLAKIIIDLKPAGVMTNDLLAGATVKLGGFHTTADISLENGSVGSMGSVSEIVMLQSGVTTEGCAATFSSIILPNTTDLSGRTVVVTVGEVDYTALIPTNARYAASKSHIYVVTVGNPEVKLGDVRIEPWDNSDMGDSFASIGRRGIWTAANLKAFAEAWNAASVSTDVLTRKEEQDAVIAAWSDDGTATGTVRVRCNIDMSVVDGFFPIGYGSGDAMNYAFTGKFDGGEHTIAGLTVVALSGGLFGYVGSEGTVCNVTLDGAMLGDFGRSIPVFCAGGIAAYNYGLISDCVVTGGSVESGSSGNGIVGGIVACNKGTISECRITDTRVSTLSKESGGIAGWNDGGTISDCLMTSGNVMAPENSGGITGRNDGGTISGCLMTGGSVTAWDSFSGGIVGSNLLCGIISGCLITGGSVTATVDCSGGIAGRNSDGAINACLMTGGSVAATGSYSGGIAGVNYNIIVCSAVSSGSVTAGNYVGGIVGSNSGNVAGCWSTATTVNSTNYSGGIAGRNNSTVIGCGWTSATSGVSAAVGDGGGSTFCVATAAAMHTEDKAVLMSEAITMSYFPDALYWTVVGIGDDKELTFTSEAPLPPYRKGIRTEADLREFARAWNAAEITTCETYEENRAATYAKQYEVLQEWADGDATPSTNPSLDNNGPRGTVRLLADITLDSGEAWVPIGGAGIKAYTGFSGRFDGLKNAVAPYGSGRNYRISGMTIPTSGASGGLFGVIAQNGRVSNVTVSGSVKGDYAGGIAGENYGTIENCFFSGNVTSSAFILGGTTTISGGGAGGIVGVNYANASVYGCGYSNGTIQCLMGSSGGIAGRNGGNINNCYVIASFGTGGLLSLKGGVVGHGFGGSLYLNHFLGENNFPMIGGNGSTVNSGVSVEADGISNILHTTENTVFDAWQAAMYGL